MDCTCFRAGCISRAAMVYSCGRNAGSYSPSSAYSIIKVNRASLLHYQDSLITGMFFTLVLMGGGGGMCPPFFKRIISTTQPLDTPVSLILSIKFHQGQGKNHYEDVIHWSKIMWGIFFIWSVGYPKFAEVFPTTNLINK